MWHSHVSVVTATYLMICMWPRHVSTVTVIPIICMWRRAPSFFRWILTVGDEWPIMPRGNHDLWSSGHQLWSAVSNRPSPGRTCLPASAAEEDVCLHAHTSILRWVSTWLLITCELLWSNCSAAIFTVFTGALTNPRLTSKRGVNRWARELPAVAECCVFSIQCREPWPSKYGI